MIEYNPTHPTKDVVKWPLGELEEFFLLISVVYSPFLSQNGKLGKKFIFSKLGEYQKRELVPALDLILMAGLFYKVMNSSGQGVPIGAHANLDHFKIIFLDVGLCQSMLNLDLSSWFLNPNNNFINKGEIVEAFIGQEFLAYSDPISKEFLYFWHREQRGSEAEIDYLVQNCNDKQFVVPVEVKVGYNKRIKSMHLFFEGHPHSNYGLRFWSHQFEIDKKIHSYPLYSVGRFLADKNVFIREAIKHMIARKNLEMK